MNEEDNEQQKEFLWEVILKQGPFKLILPKRRRGRANRKTSEKGEDNDFFNFLNNTFIIRIGIYYIYEILSVDNIYNLLDVRSLSNFIDRKYGYYGSLSRSGVSLHII